MKIYYTGATTALGQNFRPLVASLGGLVSGTMVPNGRKNSLFPDFSKEMLEKSGRLVIGIVLKNDALVSLTNLVLNLVRTTSNTQIVYKVGTAEISGDLAMEQIQSSSDLPYNTTFMALTSEVVLASSLDVEEYLGLWLMVEYEAISDYTSLAAEDFVLNFSYS